jgi:hypothetical protein
MESPRVLPLDSTIALVRHDVCDGQTFQILCSQIPLQIIGICEDIAIMDVRFAYYFTLDISILWLPPTLQQVIDQAIPT